MPPSSVRVAIAARDRRIPQACKGRIRTPQRQGKGKMKTEPTGLSRRKVLGLFAAAGVAPLAAGLISASAARAAALPPVEVWKDPNCGCCGAWAQHMRRAGFRVTVSAVDDMDSVRKARGVPEDLQSCHTAVVDGYVVEGHVPAADVERLLAERPVAKGLAAPGMPASAPGMDQPGEPYAVILFGAPTGNRIYSNYAG
jgi:hypothetical protein